MYCVYLGDQTLFSLASNLSSRMKSISVLYFTRQSTDSLFIDGAGFKNHNKLIPDQNTFLAGI